jgi:hypothetical protein
MATDASVQSLLGMVGRDHFAAESLYSGVQDSLLKAQLNSSVDAAAKALAVEASSHASMARLLAVMKAHLYRIDRSSLETEDAEHVAGLFDQMLEVLGITSSEGILNKWLYGFDPK